MPSNTMVVLVGPSPEEAIPLVATKEQLWTRSSRGLEWWRVSAFGFGRTFRVATELLDGAAPGAALGGITVRCAEKAINFWLADADQKPVRGLRAKLRALRMLLGI